MFYKFSVSHFAHRKYWRQCIKYLLFMYYNSQRGNITRSANSSQKGFYCNIEGLENGEAKHFNLMDDSDYINVSN